MRKATYVKNCVEHIGTPLLIKKKKKVTALCKYYEFLPMGVHVILVVVAQFRLFDELRRIKHNLRT